MLSHLKMVRIKPTLHLCSSRLYSRKNFLDWLDITSIAIKCKIFHRKWFFDAESSQTPHTFPFALLSSVDYSIQLCPHSKYEHLEGISKVGPALSNVPKVYSFQVTISSNVHFLYQTSSNKSSNCSRRIWPEPVSKVKLEFNAEAMIILVCFFSPRWPCYLEFASHFQTKL